MNGNGEAMYLAIDLMKETGMLSYKVEQSFRSDFERLASIIACYFL